MVRSFRRDLNSATNWLRRRARSLSMSTTATMPAGQSDIPSAWRGEEMAAQADRWLVQLTSEEIAELEQAARSYLATTKEIGEITKEKFPLPTFGAHLAELK